MNVETDQEIRKLGALKLNGERLRIFMLTSFAFWAELFS